MDEIGWKKQRKGRANEDEINEKWSEKENQDSGRDGLRKTDENTNTKSCHLKTLHRSTHRPRYP